MGVADLQADIYRWWPPGWSRVHSAGREEASGAKQRRAPSWR
jgi:hypothetical protein